MRIQKLKWIESVMTYAAERADTEETLRTDPDLQLVPNLIDKIVVPKLERGCNSDDSSPLWFLKITKLFHFGITEIVRAQWDPISVSETRSLVATVRNILEYSLIPQKSKFLTQLMKTIIDKIDQAIENDVFIPMLPKQWVK